MERSRRGRLSHGEKGTRHWRWQRVSALLLIPLSLWLILSFGDVVYSHYDQSLAWASAPLSGILLGLTLISLLFHGHLGIAVVIDDSEVGRAPTLFSCSRDRRNRLGW